VKRVAALVLVAAAILVVFAWRRPAQLPPPSSPSVLLITVDTQRPDRLGCYGYGGNHTPAVDSLAAQGVLFEKAYCDIPWTTGSMASVMTGHYSSSHGLQLPMHRLRGEAVTLAEILTAHGYQTSAIIGSFPLDSVYGLDQGFAVYDDEFSLPIFEIPGKVIEDIPSYLDEDPLLQQKFLIKKLTNNAYRTDRQVSDAAVKWLEGVYDGRPFFLWVHYYGPHEKIGWHKPMAEQEPDMIAAYDGDVEIADAEVGRVLDWLRTRGLLDHTLVIYHSDHGQSLGEHDYVGHGLNLYEPSVQIPMVIRYPRLFPAGEKRDDLVRNVDLRPTVLDVLQLEDPRPGSGRSLVDPAENSSEEVYLETYASSLTQRPIDLPSLGKVLAPVSRNGLRTPDWKFLVSRVVGPCQKGGRMMRTGTGGYYVENSQEIDLGLCLEGELVELYDPREEEEVTANVADENPQTVSLMRQRLEQLRTDRMSLREEFVLSEEEKAKLKSLGYLQ